MRRTGLVFIGWLIVHPDHQNQGTGKQLMYGIERCFAATGRFELFTGSKSKKNIRFCQNLGYRIFWHENLNNFIEFVYLEKISSRGSSA